MFLICCHYSSLCLARLTASCHLTVLSPCWVLPLHIAAVSGFLYFRLIVLYFSFDQV